MKPNLVIVQPAHAEMNFQIEKFCEHFCATHYVYLIRPGSEPREDSPAGLRFLSHSTDQLPGFAEVDTAVSVGDVDVANRLKQCYPESKLVIWDPAVEEYLPEILVSLLRPTVIIGEFGTSKKVEYDRAM